MTAPKIHSPSRQKGVTLIELMVAGVLLGLAITGVMSMLGSSRSIALDKVLHQQAMILATNTLEDTNYSAKKYALPVKTEVSSVQLQTDTIHFISARLTLTIESPTSIIWNDENANKAIPVPYQTLRVRVDWNLPGTSASDSLFLSKTISPI